MRIGVFHNAPYYLRFYETALTTLLDRGHRLLVARADSHGAVKLPAALRRHPRVAAALYPNSREDGLDQTIKIVRCARDLLRYETPPLRGADANRQRAFAKLMRALGAADAYAPLPDVPWSGQELGALGRVFARIEEAVPPNERLCRFIADQRLDVVVSITRVNIAAKQNEIPKAARASGVPSGTVVYSWDNLSSKGLLHVHPDRLFVWNEVQAKEAEELHGVDPARIVVTGAPRFDAVFAGAPSRGRDELLRELGLGAGRPTVLYVGSSTFVAPREPEFVDAWLRAVRAADNAGLRDANVVVRPHPGSLGEGSPWSSWRAPAGEPTVLAADVRRSREQDLYDQLFAADAVVGLNTSAEIEAAIVGRPVLTVAAGEIAPGQAGSRHFDYLLSGSGGCVLAAASLEEHAAQLAEALEHDALAEARRRFLESFVRPLGLDRPAGPALADAIEALGRRSTGMRQRLRLTA